MSDVIILTKDGYRHLTVDEYLYRRNRETGLSDEDICFNMMYPEANEGTNWIAEDVCELLDTSRYFKGCLGIGISVPGYIIEDAQDLVFSDILIEENQPEV